MRMATFLAAAMLGLWPGLASALDISDFNLVSTEDLYRICSVAPSDPTCSQALAFCEGFVVGALSYHDAISDRKHLQRFVCYPVGASRNEGIKAFVNWAAANQKNQKFMNEPPIYGAIRGLASKWPCKGS